MSTLLVTVDAVRADHLSQYGYDRETMPVVDALVDDGAAFFANAYANGTNTGVSLPSMLTSRYRGDGRLDAGPTLFSPLPADVSTLAIHSNTYFGTKCDRIHGVDTFEDFGITESDSTARASRGKRLFRRTMDAVRPVVEDLGVRSTAERIQEFLFPAHLIHDFSVYEDAAATTDRALELLDGVDGEFVAWVHYMDPHRPYGIDLDSPRFGDPADEREIAELMSKAGIHPDRISPAERRRIVDLYDSDLYYTSTHLERLFDGLRERGLWEGTNVILTADHGEEFGDHGCYFHRNRPYDELLHVPMLVKSEGTAGGVIEEQRELLDVAPTVCALQDVDPSERFRGRDLRESGDRRVVATGSFRDGGPVAGVRWDGWKYITVDGDPELYDLVADPDETDDVAAANPDVCEEAHAGIPPSILEGGGGGVPDAEDVSSDVEDRLAELGYLE